MKKIYSSILAICICSYGVAQVTINSVSLSQGDIVIMERDTAISLTVDLSNNGTGKTWDLSALQSHDRDTTLLDDPANGIWSSYFPNADMMVHDNNDSSSIYIDKTISGIRIIGFVEVESNGDTSVRDWELPFIGFPSSLGSMEAGSAEIIGYKDTANFDPDGAGPHPYVDSLRGRYVIVFHADMDAEGVLTLPTGDFDVLRQVNWQERTLYFEMYTDTSWSVISDTVASLLSIDSISTDSAEYEIRFWTDDPAADFFIAGYYLDSTLTTNQDRVEWKNVTPTPDNIAENSELINNVYPIPANGSVVISLKEFDGKQSYELLTMSGQTLRTGRLTAKLSTIDVSSLSTGVYLLKVNSDKRSEYIKLAVK